jgi:hypothetical protein
MSHQPFEAWMLGEEAISEEQAAQLRGHLAACDSCQALSSAWAEVRGLLETAPSVAPAPGFVDRWQVRMVGSRLRTSQAQAWAVLGFTGGFGLALAWILAFQALALVRSPAYLAIEAMELLTPFLLWLFSLRELLSGLLENAAQLGPYALWVAGVVALAGIGVLLVRSLYRYAFRGATK